MADLQAAIDAAQAEVTKQGETVRSLKAAVKTGDKDKVPPPLPPAQGQAQRRTSDSRY